MKSIVLLSGPVGAGKTTVAKELVAQSPSPLAYIEGDTFWSFIAKSKPKAVDGDLKTIMTSMTVAAMMYALAGYETILDFSVPPWFLGTVLTIIRRRDVPLDFVVLRPSEAICAARAAARTEGTISNYSPYLDLYASFDHAARHIICNDASEPALAAAHIRERLDEGFFRVNDEPD